MLQPRLLGVVLGSILAVSALTPAGALAADADVSATTSPPALGTFRNTYYYVVAESDYPNLPADAQILDLRDRVLARVSQRFKQALKIEGTGKLLDGRVVNFAGVKDGESRYRLTPHPFGDGIGTCALVPFHTVAVDPDRIPLGSLVQIDETIGMKLPDGSLHDGFWRAEDIGSAIKQDRVDLFVGTAADGAALAKNGITHLMPLTLRIVESAPASSCAFKLWAEEDL